MVILMAGTFATVSRTAVVMLVAAGLVFLVLRFRETCRLAPLLIPMLIVVHAAVPGALGAVKLAFTPPGGLIAEHQSKSEAGEGRLADIAPSLELFREKPLLGYGFGTMQTTGPDTNAAILDNQWLASLLSVGLVGLLALVWLFMRFIRDVGRRARHERSVEGWLLVALVASVAAFGVGMFTYDAFAFTQVTFVFFVILALASVLVLAPDPVLAPSSQPAPGGACVRFRLATLGDLHCLQTDAGSYRSQRGGVHGQVRWRDFYVFVAARSGESSTREGQSFVSGRIRALPSARTESGGLSVPRGPRVRGHGWPRLLRRVHSYRRKTGGKKSNGRRDTSGHPTLKHQHRRRYRPSRLPSIERLRRLFLVAEPLWLSMRRLIRWSRPPLVLMTRSNRELKSD